MKLYQIRDWHKNFETERTATFKRRQQIDFSTDINDMVLIWLLGGHENGPIHFAIWVLLCEWYANTSPPRQGWITHNGKETGIPLTAKDLASIIHIPEKWVKEAIDRLSQPQISWITVERSVSAECEQRGSGSYVAPPILSHPIPPNPIPPKRKRREYPAEFERLWKIHPKGGKINALKAMEKHDPDESELNRWIEKLEAFKKTEQWTKDGGKWANNLSTWINGGFFDGEIPRGEETLDEQWERIEREKSQE